MMLMMDSQELARRFNEDEAVRQRYEQIRELRRRVGSDLPPSEEVLDYLDWLQPERECRTIRAIGFLSGLQK